MRSSRSVLFATIIAVLLINFALLTSAVYVFDAKDRVGEVTLDKWDIASEPLKEKYFKISREKRSGDVRMGQRRPGEVVYQRLVFIENNEDSPSVFLLDISAEEGKIHYTVALNEPDSSSKATIKAKAFSPSHCLCNVEVHAHAQLYIRILIATHRETQN